VTSIGDKAAWRDLGLPEGLIESAKADLPFSALLDAQSRIIDHMASGHDLRETLSEITKLVETLAPPALCTILLLDTDGRHLRVGAAPSPPECYNQIVDGIEIGPAAGLMRHRGVSSPGGHRQRYRDRPAVGVAP